MLLCTKYMDYLISSAQQSSEVQWNELLTGLVNRCHHCDSLGLSITVLSPSLDRLLDLRVPPFNFPELISFTELCFYVAVTIH